eukprot:jgi/Chlat1/477/Chrsp103S00010
MAEALEEALLRRLDETPDGAIADSSEAAAAIGVDHLTALVPIIRRLASFELLAYTELDRRRWVLTKEAVGYAAEGSPEARLFSGVAPGDAGTSLGDLRSALGHEAADIGFKQAMQNKWVRIEKRPGSQDPMVLRKVDSVEDRCKDLLQAVQNGEEVAQADLDYLSKKRKLITMEITKVYSLVKGPKFALKLVKPATDLTAEMMASGAWKTAAFKDYNFDALGLPTTGGHLHPLLKVRRQFREIFLEMGFEEMPTNNFVESSFWNFDALFQPQMHPARDAHDTFFLSAPSKTNSVPEDYLQRVKEVHQTGGYGSVGYGGPWKRTEAFKNLLRTHTTAVSSRMLYRLAQSGFRPAKFFSIDRVFRNEHVDRTHLAEFHQIEGVICDKGVTLADLIGTLAQFFERPGSVADSCCAVLQGMKQLRFKPAYNPYTEPSMEIFAWHPLLKKWVEVGNSGMFRPEMLRPMGLPDDVNVIAWGLGLERPTMILYNVENIRDLFGHKVSLLLWQYAHMLTSFCQLINDKEQSSVPVGFANIMILTTGATSYDSELQLVLQSIEAINL